MTSRERFMIALSNGRADRMPCQVHGWMGYYLEHFAKTYDWMEADDKYGFDHALYVGPRYIFSDKDLANWREERIDLPANTPGCPRWKTIIHTPDGDLQMVHEANAFTNWNTEHLLKTEDDIRMWMKWRPKPIAADMTDISNARKRLGDNGIVRTFPFSPGQGSPWQSFCTQIGTTEAIYLANDEPDFMHEILNHIVQVTLDSTELLKGIEADMIELGGGAGSDTVISPKMFKEFCVPYDQKQNEAYHALGLKTVYHLCGGVMGMLDLVVENGSDGLETMTPPSMGGNCDLKKASAQVGDKLFFVGGFDQNQGFENGTPQRAKELVYECFEATKDHAGYIIAPSDHFFVGDEANLRAFCEAVRECTY